MARVVLDPLAEVGIGMFVAVLICGSQFVVNLQCRGKGRYREQEAHDEERDKGAAIAILVTTNHHIPATENDGVSCNKAPS